MRLNSDLSLSSDYILNISFVNINSDELIMALDNLAISSGSACISAGLEPSYVLQAMGLDRQSCLNSLRFSLGRFVTKDEIDYAIEVVSQTVTDLYRTN